MDKLIAGVIPLPGLQVVIHDIQPDEPEDTGISMTNALESELAVMRRQYADLNDDYLQAISALEAIANGGDLLATQALQSLRKGGR